MNNKDVYNFDECSFQHSVHVCGYLQKLWGSVLSSKSISQIYRDNFFQHISERSKNSRHSSDVSLKDSDIVFQLRSISVTFKDISMQLTKSLLLIWNVNIYLYISQN